MRTIIVGDIHGCIKEFKELVNKTNYNKLQDRLILVGDLINKGPSSKAVIDFAIEQKAQAILGNHELKFIDAIISKKVLTTKMAKIKQEFGANLSFYLNYLNNLPPYIEEDDYIVVHAGVAPNMSLNETPLKILTKIRTWDGIGNNLDNNNDLAWYEFYKESKLIVFGHWAKRGLIVRDNVIGLDSGCVYGKKLSCVILPERKIISVDAHKAYNSITI